MDKNYLFLKTLEDIDKKLQSNDIYEIFMISALIRKLLIDRESLVDQVNSKRKLKILFEVNDDRKPPTSLGPDYWFAVDGFDPNTSHTSKPIKVSRVDFLKRPLMMIHGEIVTVKELIRYLCHVQGSVHAGKPKNSKEATLKEIESFMSIGGMPSGVRTIMSVSRVILRGLEPLSIAIKKDL